MTADLSAEDKKIRDLTEQLVDRRSSHRLPVQRPPFDDLRQRVSGDVVEPGSVGYAELATPWNVAVAVAPACVVAVRTDQDVVETVRFAARHGLTVTPQATGHGAVAGLVGEILVSTVQLDECVVHQEGWARVGAGVKWARVVEAAAPFGLAPLNGSSTDVGVVGYTTGGGLGPMARTHGLASDRVRAIEVVTGDGVLRRVTPTDEPELFFGLRGGKGALGIVTALEFDLVHQPTFYGGALYFDGDDAEVLVDRWRTWSAALPERATTSFALLNLPPLPDVPPPLAGRLTLAVRFVWTGEVEQGRRLLAELRSAAPVILDGVDVLPYRAIDAVHADPVEPMPVHEAAALLSDFPPQAVSALLRVAGPGAGSPQVIVEVRQLGGALARPGQHESAYSHRAAAYSLLTIGVPGTGDVAGHGASVVHALSPWVTRQLLPNWAPSADVGTHRYDGSTLARLQAAVRSYDPAGVMALGRSLTR